MASQFQRSRQPDLALVANGLARQVIRRQGLKDPHNPQTAVVAQTQTRRVHASSPPLLVGELVQQVQAVIQDPA